MPQLSNIVEWDQAYIETLPSGEYDWIEYKAAAWFSIESECLDQLSKYASAYANYDGGYIIVGTKERKAESPIIDNGGVDLSIKKNLKSWLEDKIPNLTDPPLPRIQISIIEASSLSPSIKPNHGVIVVYVPPSPISPHQARDRKFYTRLGSKLSPLGVRAIMDMFQRTKHATLRAEVSLNFYASDKNSLFIRVVNESDVLVRHIGVRIRCPIFFRKTNLAFSKFTIDSDTGGNNCWVLKFDNQNGAPLFPWSDTSHSFPFRMGVRFDPPFKNSIPDLEVRLYADAMPFHEQRFQLDNIIGGCDDIMRGLLDKMK